MKVQHLLISSMLILAPLFSSYAGPGDYSDLMSASSDDGVSNKEFVKNVMSSMLSDLRDGEGINKAALALGVFIREENVVAAKTAAEAVAFQCDKLVEQSLIEGGTSKLTYEDTEREINLILVISSALTAFDGTINPWALESLTNALYSVVMKRMEDIGHNATADYHIQRVLTVAGAGLTKAILMGAYVGETKVLINELISKHSDEINKSTRIVDAIRVSKNRKDASTFLQNLEFDTFKIFRTGLPSIMNDIKITKSAREYLIFRLTMK